jgi:hypothetical protein
VSTHLSSFLSMFSKTCLEVPLHHACRHNFFEMSFWQKQSLRVIDVVGSQTKCFF